MFLTQLMCGTQLPARLGLTISCLLALAGILLYIGHRSLNHASAAQPLTPSSLTAATKSRLVADYGALPLAFERNDGQVDSQVKYLARGRGYTLFLTPSVVPSFSLTATAPSPNPVAKGSTATSTVTMQFDPGFFTGNSVALTCSGATGITCTPNPASVTSAGPTSTVTINVSSTASLHSIWALWLSIPGLAVAGVGLGSAMSTKRKTLGVLLGCLLFTALLFQLACSNSNSGGGTARYTVTVTGTGGGQTSSVPISGSFK